jgi:hypothetical protein
VFLGAEPEVGAEKRYAFVERQEPTALAETDRERRVRRVSLPLGAVRKCLLVDGRVPALGHRLQHPRRLRQRERRRVPHGEHPVEPSSELHALAQHHVE